MIYIDASPEILELARLWTPSSIDVQFGTNTQDALEKIQERVRCIFVYPWDYIEKDSVGSPNAESQVFISQLAQAVKDGNCIIFGGNGEISIFGETSIITEPFNRKKYLELLDGN